jgi:beta-mannosidase
MKMILDADWQMTWEPLYCQAEHYYQVRNKQQNWLQTHLPCDVHMPLIEQGIIAEPLLADHCFDSEWIEQRSWWFKKEFQLTESQLSYERIVITFESLDVEADIWLNDIHLGHHRSAFYPFSFDLKGRVQPGMNQIFVRITTGLERYSGHELAQISETKVMYENEQIGQRGDNRRGMLRKAQYVFGWDWGPRVATCGIMGGVTIDFSSGFQICDVHVTTVEIDAARALAQLSFQLELENLHPFRTLETDLELELLFDSQRVALIQTERCLRSGLNYVALSLEVQNAKLWWPNGMGEQPLYSVRVSAQTREHRVDYPPFSFGVRTLRLNMDKLSDRSGERAFGFEINGVFIFSKGGNWIPADSIYARVTDEKYDRLVRDAKEAEFNMLRVWGGGIYEKDIFYEKCDEYGILIWHDFMFSCAKYPDHLAWFREEVEREIDYQTRRLRNHCAMALWCGNNENHWGFDEWWKDTLSVDYYSGSICCNEIAPRLVARNCPDIPYWNSSPYGGAHPNGNESGDRHHWDDCAMNENMEKRVTPEQYDEVKAKFISEFGYIGPCRQSSIEIYHHGQPLDRNSRIWQLHNNTFEKNTVLAGIQKHYMNSAGLAIDDYLLYAGLCQGLMLGYAIESMRAKPDCSGALFWMYNDCWGEVGWTIIDYYLTRKISYYFVKRAFAPVKLILRRRAGFIQLTAINETGSTITEILEYGFMEYDGSGKQTTEVKVELPAYSRSVVLQWGAPSHQPKDTIIFARPVNGSSRMQPAIMKADVLRRLPILKSQLTIDDIRSIDADHTQFTVSSRSFAHAVHFGLNDASRLSDEYFDLLPGERREIIVQHEGFPVSADTLVPHSIISTTNASK